MKPLCTYNITVVIVTHDNSHVQSKLLSLKPKNSCKKVDFNEVLVMVSYDSHIGYSCVQCSMHSMCTLISCISAHSSTEEFNSEL